MSYKNNSQIGASCDVCGKDLTDDSGVEVGDKKYCEDCINEIINVGIASKVSKSKKNAIKNNDNNSYMGNKSENNSNISDSSENNSNDDNLIDSSKSAEDLINIESRKSDYKEDFDLNDIYSDNRLYDEIHNEEKIINTNSMDNNINNGSLDANAEDNIKKNMDETSSRYLGQETINPLDKFKKAPEKAPSYQNTLDNINEEKNEINSPIDNNSLNKIETSEEEYIKEKYGKVEANKTISNYDDMSNNLSKKNAIEDEEQYIKEKYGFLLDELEETSHNTPNIQNPQYNTYNNNNNNNNNSPHNRNNNTHNTSNYEDYNPQDNYNNQHGTDRYGKRTFDPLLVGEPANESKNTIPESRTKLISKWKNNGKTKDKSSKIRNPLHMDTQDKEKEKTIQFILTAILVVLIVIVASYIIYVFTLSESYGSFGEAISYLFTDPGQLFSKMFGG
ncbi:MAG: hypothetical protein ACRCVG_02285 [Methanobacteriaceae archaeon]